METMVSVTGEILDTFNYIIVFYQHLKLIIFSPISFYVCVLWMKSSLCI